MDRGIELYRKVYPDGKNDTFSISWSAFYLDPEAPEIGIPLLERIEQRFGKDRLLQIREALRKQGLQDGVNFSTESRIGNTRNAHRLIQLAKTKGNDTENRVVMELFKGYFEEGGDITSFDTLTEAAVRAGLTEIEAREWLESGKGGEAVDEEVKHAYARGIHGVPNFTIQENWAVDGAQDPKDFFDIIVAAKEGRSVSSSESGLCS